MTDVEDNYLELLKITKVDKKIFDLGLLLYNLYNCYYPLNRLIREIVKDDRITVQILKDCTYCKGANKENREICLDELEKRLSKDVYIKFLRDLLKEKD